MAGDSGINLEYPVLITDAAGVGIWQGCGFTMNVVRAINTTTAAPPGTGMVYGALLVQAWAASTTAQGYATSQTGYATTSDPLQQVLKVTQCTAATNTLWAGVSLTPAAVNGQVILAGVGSVVPVRSLNASGGTTITSNTAGNYVIGSATAGLVNAITPAAMQALTTTVSALGRVVRIAGTTGGQTDSGATDQLVVLVGSGYAA